MIGSEELQNDDGIQKPYTQYSDKYIIISEKEKFEEFRGKKIKRAWYNDKGKMCLESFIYLDNDKRNEKNFLYVKVINGKSEKPRLTISFEEIFNNQNLVFVGFLETDRIQQELLAKAQGL